MAVVQYRGGPLISGLEIVCVYLNVSIDAVPTGDWQSLVMQGSDKALSDHLDNFLDDLTSSEYMEALTEYSATSTDGTYYKIVRGKRVESHLIAAGPFNKYSFIGYSPESAEIAMFDANNWMHIVPWLSKAIENHSLPYPNPNLCYFVFTPPGVVLKDDAEGAHFSFPFPIEGAEQSISTVYYAVIAHPNSLQPLNVETTLDQFDQLTLTISHELVETITDPESHTGWSSIQSEAVKFEGEEIADLCATRSFSVAGYQVSSFWSERRRQCVGCEMHIHLKNGTGVGGIIEGQVAHFLVEVPCLAKEFLTYHWTMSGGGTLMGSDAEADFFVRMPPSPSIVTVTVTITVTNPREVQISTIATCQSIRSHDGLS